WRWRWRRWLWDRPGGDKPVAAAGAGCRHPNDRLGSEVDATHRSVETGVAEGEHPTVASNEPISPSKWSRGHARDGLDQRERARRTEEGSVPKTENAAVRSHEPIAVSKWSRGHADDRSVERDGTGRAVECSVAERE